jgi:hypothetical protein
MSEKPAFLLESPKPKLSQMQYNGQKLIVWEGETKISSIKGWAENPRISVSKGKLLNRVGSREPTQDEIYDLMKNDPDVKLKILRDDIMKNGLRDAITLSYRGKLLDGNRRFFAIKYALDEMPKTHPDRSRLETVKVLVLDENATEEDEQNVLVEENFSPSLKIEWPDYVKALLVVDCHDDGLTAEEISKKFGWSRSKIKETLRINEITSEFMNFATADADPTDESGGGLGLPEQEAKTIVAKNYQFFNEAQKSFFDSLKTDFDFKIQFFKWIHSGKFSSFPEVRVAYNAWKHPEAKAALMQPDPSASKAAKAILDYNSRVVKSGEEAIGRIDTFAKFLNEMTAAEIKTLPPNTVSQLEKALETIIKMSKAAVKQ